MILLKHRIKTSFICGDFNVSLEAIISKEIYVKKYGKACLQCPLKCFSFTNWNHIKWNNPLTYF